MSFPQSVIIVYMGLLGAPGKVVQVPPIVQILQVPVRTLYSYTLEHPMQPVVTTVILKTIFFSAHRCGSWICGDSCFSY